MQRIFPGLDYATGADLEAGVMIVGAPAGGPGLLTLVVGPVAAALQAMRRFEQREGRAPVGEPALPAG